MAHDFVSPKCKQAGLSCVSLLLHMASAAVTHWYTFRGLADLGGTITCLVPWQGLLEGWVQLRLSTETLMWLLQHGSPGYVDFLHGSSGLEK